jgi:hypothetical protein
VQKEVAVLVAGFFYMLSDDFISKRSSTSTANTSWEPSTLFVSMECLPAFEFDRRNFFE